MAGLRKSFIDRVRARQAARAEPFPQVERGRDDPRFKTAREQRFPTQSRTGPSPEAKAYLDLKEERARTPTRSVPEPPPKPSASERVRGAAKSALGNTEKLKPAAGRVARFGAKPTDLKGLRGFVKGSLGAGLAAEALNSAWQGYNTPTEAYRRGLGMDPDDDSLGWDLVARGTGVLQDFGANLVDNTVGTVGKLAGRNWNPGVRANLARMRGLPPPDEGTPEPEVVPPESLRSQDERQPGVEEGAERELRRQINRGLTSPSQRDESSVVPFPGTDGSDFNVRMDAGIRSLRDNPEARQAFNALQGLRGSGIDASVDDNGLVLSNRGQPGSPEEMREQRLAALESDRRADAMNRDNNARRLGLADRGDPDFYLTGAGAPGRQANPEDTGVYGQTRAEELAEQADNRLSGLRTRALEEIAGGRATRKRNIALQSMVDSIDRAGSSARQDSTTRRGQDIDADLRRQDLESREADRRELRASRRDDAAARAAQQEQRYELDVAKYGEQRAENLRKGREEAVKNMHSRILTMVPPGRDGKADSDTAARYTEGLNAMFAQQVDQLRAVLNDNPGDAQAARLLEELEQKGLGALDESDVRRYVAGMQARDLQHQSAGRMPWSGSAVDSASPITSLRRRPGVIFDDYVDQEGGTIPARKVDRTGLFGDRRTRFDSLIDR